MTYQELADAVDNLIAEDPTVKRVLRKLTESTVNFDDAHEYAIALGEALGKALAQPGALMDASALEIERLVGPALGRNYAMAAEVARAAVQAANDKAGIKLQALTPELRSERAEGIVTEIQNRGYATVAEVLPAQIVNLTESAVDDAIVKNAEVQLQAGYSSKIVRRAERGACRWCRGLEGSYDYEDVRESGSEVFRRHDNCRCHTYFLPDGKLRDRQSVWRKGYREAADAERIGLRRSTEQRLRRAGRWDDIYKDWDRDRLTGEAEQLRTQIARYQDVIKLNPGLPQILRSRYRNIIADVQTQLAAVEGLL